MNEAGHCISLNTHTLLNRLADRLSKKLGVNYIVKADQTKISVYLPGRADEEGERSRINTLLAELNEEQINHIEVEIAFWDEENGPAPHRQLVRLLRRHLDDRIMVNYNNNHIELKLPDNNNNDFVNFTMVIISLVRKLIAVNLIRLNDDIRFRVFRSYRDIDFVINTNSEILYEDIPGVFSEIQLRILHHLHNPVITINRLRSADLGISDSKLHDALHDLEVREFIGTDHDFLVGGFYDEGETPQQQYPAQYLIRLADETLSNSFKE